MQSQTVQAFEHTPEFSRRRRALFPCDGDSTANDDLNSINPLSSDSNSDEESSGFSQRKLLYLRNGFEKYDIIGVVEQTVQEPTGIDITPQNTKTNFEPPLPKHNIVTSPFSVDTSFCSSEETPTQKLKTPSETFNSPKLPRLIRKTVADSSVLNSNCVETALFENCFDPHSNHSKNSKVRTALFPEPDMSLPPRSFYPKVTTSSPHFSIPRKFATKEVSCRKPRQYLGQKKNRKQFGQINAGVRHNIKKPKKSRRSNEAVVQAALNILENSPLNDFFNESTTEKTEPDPTKKFFKTSSHKSVTTVIDNLKVQLSNGKMSLIEPINKLKRTRNDCNSGNSLKRFKSSNEKIDLNSESEPLISSTQISEIMSILEDKENQSDDGANILLSPTSQMCDMASGLAINSPKKARNLNPVLEKLAQPKLFPVFYPGKVKMPEGKNVASPKNAKKFKPIAKDQMLLDAGQKNFKITQCFECKFLYHMGDPSDEIIHLNYHNAIHILNFQGWKNERVVSNASLDGRIVQVLPSDPKAWWKKIKDLVEVVNRDLGFFEMEVNMENSQVFLYVKNKTIVGVLVAEVKNSGHRMLTSQFGQVDFCSEENYPIKCGVSRIWVSPNFRNKGIGTALVDSLKSNFVFGSILKNEDIAFSSPTEMGKLFATSYFKTPNFLIYYE